MRYVLFAVIALVGGGIAGGEVTVRRSPKSAKQSPSDSTVSAAGRRVSKSRLAEMLPERPEGFGRPITDRAAWRALAKRKSYRQVVPQAGKLPAEPIEDQPDELYLDFSRTGNRTRWQKVAGGRRGRIRRLTLAECLENKGRFLPALEKIIAAICAERTWVYPAHDRSLANFKGRRTDIDLASSALAWELATADYLLGDKLKPAARRLIRDNIDRRIFQPYLAMLSGKREKNWWMTTTNNWNAVCLANVTGSALALIGSRDRRAEFVHAAGIYSRNFLKGFTSDGYCSEGVGYWNYGFGHYVLLAEAVHQATRGGVDMMAGGVVRICATYPWRIEIMNGVYPAFADCAVTARPSARLMHFLSRRCNLGGEAAGDGDMVAPGGGLFEAMMYSLANSATKSPRSKAAAGVGIRSWFDKAGVLIGRPAAGSSCRMGVALKGGHNAEHHNHNDVGSYVVAVGRRAVLLDPGAEVYTARTFSSRRYQSNVLNSFGHPVPKVAGRLQEKGRRACGRVVRTEFTDKADTLVLDIRPAYKVPDLKVLRRTFVYSRDGAGSLTVTDEAAFVRAKEFETALITMGKWKRLNAKSLIVRDENEALRVDIEVTGGEFEIHAEKIKENVRAESLPIRLAVRLNKPVRKAMVTVKISPPHR